MKKTSPSQPKVHSDITLIQSTLADLTLAEFLALSPAEIERLTILLEVSGSDDLFAVVFPKEDVLRYQKYVRQIAHSETILTFNDDESYAEWCCRKLQEKSRSCATKMAEMLRGSAFGAALPELSEEKMQAYTQLYTAVTGDDKSLADVHRGKQYASARL